MRSCLILASAASDDDVAAALKCGAEALLLQLGPCVEDEARRNARARVCAIIGEARPTSGPPKLFVEIAPLGSDLVEADLDALFGPGPDGVFLPACTGAGALQRMAAKLAVREAQAGLPDAATRIAAFVGGDPSGVLALPSFAGAWPRLAALAFDEASLRAALGLSQGGGSAIETARAMTILAAASAGVPALAPAPAAGEETAYAAARREGFSGAMALYPDQIATIRQIFPTAENRQSA